MVGGVELHLSNTSGLVASMETTYPVGSGERYVRLWPSLTHLTAMMTGTSPCAFPRVTTPLSRAPLVMLRSGRTGIAQARFAVALVFKATFTAGPSKTNGSSTFYLLGTIVTSF